MEIKLAPSILSADFAALGEDVRHVTPEADLLHVDVMDGHFVPNLTVGPAVVASLSKCTDLPLDCHLMIESPSDYYEQFAEAGASWITFHREATDDPGAEIEAIRSLGVRVGMSISPDTPFEEAKPWIRSLDLFLVMSVYPGFAGQRFIEAVLPKIESARQLVNESGVDVDIEVDGGIGEETAASAVAAGANVLVAGSAIFGASSPLEAARRIRNAVSELLGTDND
ncbi:MAG: ribulose-phosphate 3-epimerase [Acidobacteria bacterium]|nr:MAG: ribulose-phosphate 3-epimerase [Acidobacteriota bacterium]